MVLPLLAKGMFFTTNDGMVIMPMPHSGTVISTDVSEDLVIS